MDLRGLRIIQHPSYFQRTWGKQKNERHTPHNKHQFDDEKNLGKAFLDDMV